MKRSAAAKAAQQASAISLVYFWFHVFFVMSRMVKYDGVSESHLSDAVTSTSQVRFQRKENVVNCVNTEVGLRSASNTFNS